VERIAVAVTTLPTTVKRFIVTNLACGDSLSEVVAKVKDEFKITVSPQAVQKYDPRRVSGKELSAGLRELFETTREKFLLETASLNLAHREIRLRKLETILDEAMAAKQWKTAAMIIAESRKQMADLMEVDTPTEDS
jgi:hypothetical protein